MIPSRSHYASADGMVFPGGTPTNWTPHGVFVAGNRVHRPAPYTNQQGMSMARNATPGAWWTPPALWNLASMSDGFLPAQLQAALGLTRQKTGTPAAAQVVAAQLTNPFPGVAPPTPSYPLPAAWPGRL